MIDVISLIAFVAFLALFLTTVYALFVFRSRSIKNFERYTQALVDKHGLESKLTELLKEKQSNELEKTDGFIKFISESRDWAFEYIETTQSVLTEFVDTVGPDLEYYDKYGRIVESVHTPMMERILEAYGKLIKVLPENENKQQGENNE